MFCYDFVILLLALESKCLTSVTSLSTPLSNANCSRGRFLVTRRDVRGTSPGTEQSSESKDVKASPGNDKAKSSSSSAISCVYHILMVARMCFCFS